MRVRYRRLLYIGIVVAFVILGVSFTFYASGYRYSTKAYTLIKVGALYVKSYPSGADVRIDGMLTNKKTPARLLNVTPGLHRITVSRDGFAQWEKTLEVQQAETNFVRDIVLFKENASSRILSSGGISPLIAANKSLYIYLDGSQRVHLTNLDSENDYLISTSIVPESLLALAPSNQALIFRAADRLYALDLNSEVATPIMGFPAASVSRVVWDSENEFIVWILETSGVLNRYDLISRGHIVFLEKVENLLSVGGTLITAERVGSDAHLRWYTKGSSSPDSDQTILSSSPLQLTSSVDSSEVIAYDGSNIWLLSADGSRRFQFNGSFLDRVGTKLLIATEFEIHHIDLTTGHDELLDRTSQPIQSVQWHPSGSYFLQLQDDQLSLIEIDGRDTRNSVPIAHTSAQNSFIFDKKGARLVLLSTTTNELLEIQ